MILLKIRHLDTDEPLEFRDQESACIRLMVTLGYQLFGPDPVLANMRHSGALGSFVRDLTVAHSSSTAFGRTRLAQDVSPSEVRKGDHAIHQVLADAVLDSEGCAF